MRISDWSSDVCSSDLLSLIPASDVITSLLSEWLANSRSRDSEALSVAIAFNLGFAERRFGRWRSVEGIGKQGTNSIAFDRHRVGIGRFDREVGHLVAVRVVHSVMRQCHRTAETDRQRMKTVRKAVTSNSKNGRPAGREKE